MGIDETGIDCAGGVEKGGKDDGELGRILAPTPWSASGPIRTRMPAKPRPIPLILAPDRVSSFVKRKASSMVKSGITESRIEASPPSM